jgi:hypothetical protein
MTTTCCRLLLWSPRILGVVVGVFFGLFALDAFGPEEPLREALAALVVHLMPAVVVLTLVAASWRREWIGGLAFIVLSVLYAAVTVRSHPDWTLLISGPLVVVGALFAWNWFHRQELHAS